MRPSRRELLYPFITVVVCIAASLPLLTKYPAPGGDEPGFVDPAINLLEHGRLSTTLYEGIIPTMEHHVFWQPPLYFVALAGWFSAVGTGLAQARAFSLLFAALIVYLVYALARRWTDPWPSFGAAVLCAISYWLTSRAVFARMDTLCVALSLAALLFQLRGAGRLAGASAGLALLAHPLGVISVAAILARPLLLRRPLAEFAHPAMFIVLAAGAWVAYALQDWDAFTLQMGLQLARKQHAAPYWNQFWMARHHAVPLAVAAASVVWLAASRRRPPGSELVAIAAVTAFAAATSAGEAGYLLYFFPLGCVALAVATGRHRLVWIAVALALANEAVILGYNVWRYRHRDYGALTRAVHAAIPPGRSVFIGFADVSPYFSLRGRNPMRTAAPVPIADTGAHMRVAEQADYIVTSEPDPYLPDVSARVAGRVPLVRIDQGPGYRVAIFANKR